jgi:hypothetical protein
MAFAVPGEGNQAEQEREREEAGEEREQADTFDPISLTLLESDPIGAMHFRAAMQQNDARQRR